MSETTFEVLYPTVADPKSDFDTAYGNDENVRPSDYFNTVGKFDQYQWNVVISVSGGPKLWNTIPFSYASANFIIYDNTYVEGTTDPLLDQGSNNGAKVAADNLWIDYRRSVCFETGVDYGDPICATTVAKSSATKTAADD